MSSPLSTYGFLSAKLKTRISKILSAAVVDQLIRAKTLPEAVQLLKGTDFEDLEKAYSETGDLRMGEYVLYVREIELYTEIIRFTEDPVRRFILSLTSRYEGDNLKKALRLWFDKTVRGRSIEGAGGYLYRKPIIHKINIEAVVNAPDINALSQILSDTPYGRLVRDTKESVLKNSSLFPLELGIDHLYYRELTEALAVLPKKDRASAEKIIGLEIDMENIGWIVRFKNFYNLPMEDALKLVIPRGEAVNRQALAEAYLAGNVSEVLSELLKKKYGKWQALLGKGAENYSRLTLMERLLKQITLSEVERLLAGYPFSIGIVLAYFILRRNEIQTLMTILNAKYYNLPEERIKSAI